MYVYVYESSQLCSVRYVFLRCNISFSIVYTLWCVFIIYMYFIQTNLPNNSKLKWDNLLLQQMALQENAVLKYI